MNNATLEAYTVGEIFIKCLSFCTNIGTLAERNFFLKKIEGKVKLQSETFWGDFKQCEVPCFLYTFVSFHHDIKGDPSGSVPP